MIGKKNKNIASKVLITNDDGVQAAGIRILASVVREWAEVWIVAPERPQNAVGRALTLHKPLRLTEVKKRTYAVNGTPADCVTLGIEIEAVLHGVPAVAISQDRQRKPTYRTAARYASRIAQLVLRHGLPEETLLNVNVPACTPQRVAGVKFTSLGRRRYLNSVIERVDPQGRKYYWIAGERLTWQRQKWSDFEAVSQCMISITPLRVDLTDYRLLKALQPWESTLMESKRGHSSN